MNYETLLKPKIVNKRTLYIFPVVYGLIIYISIRLANDVISNSRFWVRPLRTTMAELIFGAMFSYIFALAVWKLLEYNLKKSKGRPSVGQTIRELAGVIFILEIIAFCTLFPLTALTDNGVQDYDIIYLGSIPLLYWLLYYTWLRGNALIKRSYEQQLQIEKISNDRLNTELQFLKAQFHPHFLFNALNTVYFQIDEENTTAKKTVEKLSELLRYQLYDQQEKVMLERELEYLHTYIAFQRERVSESLQLEFTVHGHTGQQKIYPLLLIPLVENAFKYTGGTFRITMTVTVAENKLNFEVVNSIPPYEPAKRKGGLGLENLKRRLNLLYPEKFILTTTKTENTFVARLILSL